MTKKELVQKVAAEAGITQIQAEKAMKAVFGAIRTEVRNGENVRIPDFGIFKSYTRAARTGINPATKEPIQIPQKSAVKLTASSNFFE